MQCGLALLSSCANAGPLGTCVFAHLDGVMKAPLAGELPESFSFQIHISVLAKRV